MNYEDMQKKFEGDIKSPTEHELWNLLVAKEEDYRLMKIWAYLGWAIAVAGALQVIFGWLS